jgi:malic enzyme
MSAGENERPIRLRGSALIRDPMLNKGTAFTARERTEFGLHGLLPSEQNTIDIQAQRIYQSLQKKHTPLEKYVGLTALQDRNEQLFYKVLCDHLEEFMPIIYTPTVGLASQNFSQVFRRGRGLWITPEFRGMMKEVMSAAVGDRDIRLIVATDNESILGIGDQGAGGMAISVGKLALYSAGAGIHPDQTLPISLDVGTNNQKLLEDELYVGWRQPRLRGEDYVAFIEEFVNAIQKLFPRALIQWEDFRKENALAIMERYRRRVPSFNDDIQGTGAVALAGLLSATRVTGSSFPDQRIVVFGAGAAGLGIARQLRAALADEGLSEERIARSLAVLDSGGLLVDDRKFRDAYKQQLAWPREYVEEIGLSDLSARHLGAVVQHYQPTVLIGSSGQAGAFDENIVRAMAEYCDRPVIMPFSNPTDHAEAVPGDILRWTQGRALIATGSPFEPVTFDGRRVQIGQGNNVFIFPGLGLGTLLSGATEITDGMIVAAARALADAVRDKELATGLLFPSVSRLREVTAQVTSAVIKRADVDGVSTTTTIEPTEALIKKSMWNPCYRDYVAA